MRRGLQESWRGGSAPKDPELKALALGNKELALRTVQKDLRKEAKRKLKIQTPRNSRGGGIYRYHVV